MLLLLSKATGRIIDVTRKQKAMAIHVGIRLEDLIDVIGRLSLRSWSY
jgi:hypothetical protein